MFKSAGNVFRIHLDMYLGLNGHHKENTGIALESETTKGPKLFISCSIIIDKNQRTATTAVKVASVMSVILCSLGIFCAIHPHNQRKDQYT